MKFVFLNNREIAGIMNCEITKYEDPVLHCSTESNVSIDVFSLQKILYFEFHTFATKSTDVNSFTIDVLDKLKLKRKWIIVFVPWT